MSQDSQKVGEGNRKEGARRLREGAADQTRQRSWLVQVDLEDWLCMQIGAGGSEAVYRKGRPWWGEGTPQHDPEQNLEPIAPIEAAVLSYLQAGEITVSRITLSLGVWGSAVRTALRALAARGYAAHVGGQTWRMTERGATYPVKQPDPADLPIIGRRRQRRDPSSSVARTLDHLDQPRYGSKLAPLLGVTRQHIRNVVERLHAEGNIRVADPDEPTFAIARHDDETILLTRAEERVLSALPHVGHVSAGRIRVICTSYRSDVVAILERLLRYGLVSATTRRWRRRETRMYQITEDGKAHWQRHEDLRKAQPIPPFPSKRIYLVMRFVAENGPTKARTVSDALGTPYQATNALFQYFKRNQLAYREGRKTHQGYLLTEYGLSILSELEVYWHHTPDGLSGRKTKN